MVESSSESQELAERLLKFHMNEIQQLLEEKQASFKKIIAEYRDVGNRNSISERLNNLKNQINSQLSYLKILDSIDSTLKIQAVCQQFFASRQIQNYSKVRITILDEEDEPNQDQHHSISNSNNNCTTAAEYEEEQEVINYVDDDFDDGNDSINDSESSISYIPNAIDISSSSIRCSSEKSSRSKRRSQLAHSPRQQPNIAFKKDIFQRLIVPNVSQQESEDEKEFKKKGQVGTLPQSKGIKKLQSQSQITSSHNLGQNNQASSKKPKTKKIHSKKTYFRQSVKQEVEDIQTSSHSVNSTVTDKIHAQKTKTFTEYLKHVKNTAKTLNLDIPKNFLDKRFYEKRCNGLRSVGTMLNDLDKIFVAKLYKALQGDVERVEDLLYLPAELITGLAAQVEKRRLLESEEEENEPKQQKDTNHIQNNNRKEHNIGVLNQQAQKRKIISSDEGERDEEEEEEEESISSSDIEEEDNSDDEDDSIFFDSYSKENTDKEESEMSEIDMVPEDLETTQKNNSENGNVETRVNSDTNINGNIQIPSQADNNSCLDDKQMEQDVTDTNLNKNINDLPIQEDSNSMKGQEENTEMNVTKPLEIENRIKDENGVQGNKNKENVEENGYLNQEVEMQKSQENIEEEEVPQEEKEKEENGISMKWLNENAGVVDKALAFDEEKDIVEEKEIIPQIEQDKLLENRGIILGFTNDFHDEGQVQETQQQEEEEALKQGLMI